jgi:serine/threonine-protein kinase
MADLSNAPEPGSPVKCVHCGDEHPAAFTHCPRTGRPLSTGRALIGRVVAERYRVTGLLGEGGMGAVYVAEHLLIGRTVALKRLHPELASDAHAVARFQREARAAASTGHENVIDVLDMGFGEDGAPFLVMEYLKGHSLAETLRRETRLVPSRAAFIVGQVLAGLSAVHGRGIVHRDLKPDNVFLVRRAGRNDHVKVLDFGISKMQRENDSLALTRTGVTLGTPFYMSPEHARGVKGLDHRVDLYATGVMLYECLSGRVPYLDANYHALLQAILRGEPPQILSLVPTLDAGLAAVVHRAIAREPRDRYASARDMLAALVPYGATDPGPDEPERMIYAPRPEIGSLDTEAHRQTTPIDTRIKRPLVAAGVIAARDSRPDAPSPARASRPTPAPVPASRISRPPPPPVATTAPIGVPVPAPDPRTATAPETQIKGSLLVAALEYLEKQHGREVLDKITAELEPDARTTLRSLILPVAWLPLGLYDALLVSAERALGSGSGAIAAEIGSATASRDLPTAHRSFMQGATPPMVLDRIPQLWKLYHSSGEAKVDTGGTGMWRVENVGVTPDSYLHAMALAGFYQRALELAGAREPRASVVQCRARGDERTITALRWR